MTPFEEVFSLLEWQGELQWFARRPDGLKLGGVVRSAEELARKRATSERGADVWVQLNPSEGFKGQRPSAEHITHFRGFLVDLDPLPGQELVAPVEWMPAMSAALGSLDEELDYELNPWIINSGRGLQAWVLSKPIFPPGNWRPMIRRAVSSLVRRLPPTPGAIFDPKVCDVVRVARLPGTVNSKTGALAELLHVGSLVPDLFDRLAAVDPGEDEPLPGETLPESVDSYEQVWVHLTATAQKFIGRGVQYPGRHTDLWHTADLLAREGLTRAAAERALWLGARACSPPLSRDDVRYALKRAYDDKRRD